MAKKNIEGQLDLFELFDSVEEFEEKIKSVPQPQGILMETGTPVMKKGFYDAKKGERVVIAYLDYNKVYLKERGAEPIVYQFAQSRDAVDYYVRQLEIFLEDKELMAEAEPAVLPEAVVLPWMEGE